MAVKKILHPTLYPKERRVEREWFISYLVPDYTTGTYIPKKYRGLLNRLPTVAEREKLAAEYISIMEGGQLPPSAQGARDAKRVKVPTATNFAALPTCIEAFIKRGSLKWKPRTLKQYRGRLYYFYGWLEKKGLHSRAIGAITDEAALDFIFHLKNRGYAGQTINSYRDLLAQLWKHYGRELKGFNPWQLIDHLPEHTQHLASYTNAVRQTIAEKLPAYNPGLWLFLQTVYYCAIRPGAELRLMKVKHINFDAGTITVPAQLAKNGKARTVIMYAGLVEQYRAAGYATQPGEHYLFSYQGQPGPGKVSVNYFSLRWRKFRKVAGIPSVYKLYGSKHTAGKRLSALFNQYITKEHFGHGSLSVTEHYTEGLGNEALGFLRDKYPVF